MGKTLRGRPRLNIDLRTIVQTVFRHRQIVAAGREIRCSPAYVHAALRNAGLGLADILEAQDVEALLGRVRTVGYHRAYLISDASRGWLTVPSGGAKGQSGLG